MSAAPSRTAGPTHSLTALAAATFRDTWGSPFLLAGLAALLIIWMPNTTTQGTDLTSASVSGHDATLLAAILAYLVGALTASRPRRFHTEPLEHSAPAPHHLRVLLTSTTMTAWAAAVLALAAIRLLMLARSATAVGMIVWWEPACSALTVLMAFLLGHLIGSCSSSLIPPAIGLAGLAILGLVGYIVVPKIGAWAFGSGINPFTRPPVPATALGRPTWGRAVWLVSLCAGCLIVLLQRKAPRLRQLLVPALVVALGAGAMIGDLSTTTAAQTATYAQMREHPARYQQCRQVAGRAYCYLPGFASRVRQWDEILDGVTAHLPEGRSLPEVTVAQFVPVWMTDLGDSLPVPARTWVEENPGGGVIIPVSTRWSQEPQDGLAAAPITAFSMNAAYTAVTGRSYLTDGTRQGLELCGSQGAVVLYLARTATPGTSQAFTLAASGQGGTDVIVLEASGGYFVGNTATALSQAMTKDQEATRTALAEHWEELTDPHTSTVRAAQVLGLDVPDLDAGTGTVCEGAQ